MCNRDEFWWCYRDISFVTITQPQVVTMRQVSISYCMHLLIVLLTYKR